MTPQKPVPITKDGLTRLQDELEDLITRKRPAAAARIQQTREDSPGSQNEGEYEEAKKEQAFIEGRIREIEQLLANTELIDEKKAHKSDEVRVGSTVVVRAGRKDQTFTIVGMAEVDPANGKVSDESPVGSALLGRKVGDDIEVAAPAGAVKMKIKKIK